MHMHRAYDNDQTSDIFWLNSSHDQPHVILGSQNVPRKLMKLVYLKKKCFSGTELICENDKALNTSMWLKYVQVNHNSVEKFKCSVCIEFADKLHGMRKYNATFIEGSKNLRASSFKEHAASAVWGEWIMS